MLMLVAANKNAVVGKILGDTCILKLEATR
jgi:hypothetical protein